MDLTLYDLAGADPELRFSPHCWRARLALAHKGLEADCRPWHFTDKDSIAPSGGGTVPVLVAGDRWIADSWAIAVWLEETYPDRPTLFAGNRGEAFFIKQWCEKVLQPTVLRFVVQDIHDCLHPDDQAYFRQTRETRLGAPLEQVVADRQDRLPAFRQMLAPLRATLESQAYVGGDRPLFSDYMVFGAFQWARTVSTLPLLETDDPVARWVTGIGGLFGGLAEKAPRAAAA